MGKISKDIMSNEGAFYHLLPLSVNTGMRIE